MLSSKMSQFVSPLCLLSFFILTGLRVFFNYMVSAGLYDVSYPRDKKRVVPSSQFFLRILSWNKIPKSERVFLVILISPEESPIRKPSQSLHEKHSDIFIPSRINSERFYFRTSLTCNQINA